MYNSFDFSVRLTFFMIKCRGGQQTIAGFGTACSSKPAGPMCFVFFAPSILARWLSRSKLSISCSCGSCWAADISPFEGGEGGGWICCFSRPPFCPPSGFLLPGLGSEPCTMANHACKGGGKVTHLAGRIIDPALPPLFGSLDGD